MNGIWRIMFAGLAVGPIIGKAFHSTHGTKKVAAPSGNRRTLMLHKIGSARYLGCLIFVPITACSSAPPCEQDTTAFVMSQNFVQRELRSPSTADFPFITDNGVSVAKFTTAAGQCAFTVRAYVDAQNAFGGTVRQNYRVKLSPDANGGEWTLIDILIY